MPHQQDAKPSGIPWPNLDRPYIDQFGPIDPYVFGVAGDMWPNVQTRLLLLNLDPTDGQLLMVRAVAAVSRKRAEDPEKIEVPGYLYVTFWRLVQKHLKKQAREQQLEEDYPAQTDPTPGSVEDQLSDKILVHEILERADPWTKGIFEECILGYSFVEIARRRGGKANSLRSRWSRKIRKLVQQIQSESDQAGD
jgi:DNA-directed RNA polymerase specialized sigma24 family protein